MPSPARTSGTSPPVEANLYPLRGTVVAGGYRLDTVIGEGPSGVVYSGWHVEEHRAYAVKVLHPDLAALTAALVRLRHDNQATGRLRHPHLAGARAHLGQDPPLLLRPLVHGESLRRRLRQGPLTVPEVARLFLVLCCALEAAHRHGVVHGDLKPENVILALRGPPAAGRGPLSDGGAAATPLVVDFGMCHLRNSEGGIGSHPLLGTVSYLAPEQIQGDGTALGGRADVFSLGALLHECLTGQMAFEGHHSSVVVAKICLGDRPRPSLACPGLPTAVDDVVARACHRVPEERLPSPRALWTALHAAVGELPGVADALRGLDADAAAEAKAPPASAEANSSDHGTVSPRPEQRQRPQRHSGAHAIRLFKQLESARAQGPGAETQALRRSTAEEAADLLRDQALAPERIAPDDEVTSRLSRATAIGNPVSSASSSAQSPSHPSMDMQRRPRVTEPGSADPPAGPGLQVPSPSPGREDATPPRTSGHRGLSALLGRARRLPAEPLPPVLGLVGRTPEEPRAAEPAPSAAALPPEPRWLRALPPLLGAVLLALVLLLVLL